MEVKEAIEYLKKAQVCMVRSTGMSANRPLYKAFMLAIFALEKQTPKKPIYESKMPRCPSCRSWIQNNESIQKYCNFCGQALDWSDK